VLGSSGIRFVGTPDGERLISEYSALGKLDFNSRIPARMAISENGFFDDLDYFPGREFETDPFYLEFLRPRGYGWVAGNCIRPPTGEIASVSVERRFTRGPFERGVIEFLNRMDPHISRASLLAIRLGLERAQAMTEALQSIGLPAAVLRRRGAVRAANAMLQQWIPSLFQDRRDRLHVSDAAADQLLGEAIGRLTMASAMAEVSSIPIAATEDRVPIILHLVPIRGAANDIYADSAALMIVTPVDKARVPSADLLQGLFDLTPAEARVARGIGEAQSVEAIAELIGTSRETVRTQLKAVLAKTGASRQSELVSLLAGKQLLR
jgi:DNA-binding CsgD family transcriptional regulator